MPTETAADRAAMLDVDEFGQAGTYTLAVGGDTELNGIFDNGFVEVETLVGVAIGSAQPQFMVRTADLPTGAADGDTLVTGAVTYMVRVLQDDGTGITLLILDRV